MKTDPLHLKNHPRVYLIPGADEVMYLILQKRGVVKVTLLVPQLFPLSNLNHLLCHHTVNFNEVDAWLYPGWLHNPSRDVKDFALFILG